MLRRALLLGIIAVVVVLAARGPAVEAPAYSIPRFRTATNQSSGIGGSFTLSTALDPLAAYTGQGKSYCLQGPVGDAACGDFSQGLVQRTVHIPSVQLSDSQR